jgi:arsenite-transporting ATPase
MPDALRTLPSLALPVRAGSLTGLAPLTALALPVRAGSLTGLAPLTALALAPTQPQPADEATAPDVTTLPASRALPAIEALAAELAAIGHGAVLTMGKGGVGKTRVATTLAVALAKRGVRVHLSTTDPAGRAFDLPFESLPTLRVSRIDPVVETARYADEVLAAAGALSPEERALIEEDLRSPCTEEIAVFKAFARVLADATHDIVVLDTAPTGHTILLLDAAQAYHRDVLRGTGSMPAEVTALLPRLRDPAFTRVLVVALAEATPVAEAERLEQDLARAGIQPFGWVLNGLLSRTDTRHPALRARAAGEAVHVARACANGRRVWAMPWSAQASWA